MQLSLFPLSAKHKYALALIFSCLSILSINIAFADKKAAVGEFLGAMDTEYPAWFNHGFLDLPEDLSDATKAGKRILILFHQAGCPYCNALVERNLSQKKIREKVRKNFEVIALNMWGDREITYFNNKQYTEKTLAEALKIQFTPTLLFYDEKAKVIQRLNGYRSPDRFDIELDYVALRQEKKTSARNYIKANFKTQKSNKSLNAENFFSPAPYNLDVTKKGNNKSRSSKPIAVFFEQKDCPDCDNLHKKVLIDKDTRKIISKFKVIQLDMWSKTPVTTPQGNKTTARDWAKKLGISFAPAIVLFNPLGKEVIRSEAFFKVFHTQGIFDYVLSEEYREEASFQRYLTERADKIRETGVSVDIWKMAK